MKTISPYLIAFFGGYSIMALEIVGFRIFAPYFGNTIYVWGSLIGVILLALSIGYYLGGVLSDKIPNIKVLNLSIMGALVYLFPVNIFYPQILHFVAKFGMKGGALLATLLLFGIPMILLSLLSPFLIKILSIDGKIGISAGKVYTISTLGSLIGTFAASFFLIPQIGSFKTFFLTNCLLFIPLIFSFSLKNKKYLLLFLLVLPLWFVDSKAYLVKGFTDLTKNDSNEKLVYIAESPYNLVYISKVNNVYNLHLNQWGRHSYYLNEKQDYGIKKVSYREFLGLFSLINKANDILILGLGGGTSLREYSKWNDKVKIDAVEIDPKVIEASEIYFGIKESSNVKIFLEDARPFLSKATKSYDFVEIDTYQGNYYIPFYLTTIEFFKDVSDRLNYDGVVAMNVVCQWTLDKKDYVADAIGNTMTKVFPTVLSLKFGGNRILFGMKKKINIQSIVQILQKIKTAQGDVGSMVDFSVENLIELFLKPDELILTDDFAPIEELTHKLIKDRSS